MYKTNVYRIILHLRCYYLFPGNKDQIKPPSIQAEATVATSSGGSENKREETTTVLAIKNS